MKALLNPALANAAITNVFHKSIAPECFGGRSPVAGLYATNFDQIESLRFQQQQIWGTPRLPICYARYGRAPQNERPLTRSEAHKIAREETNWKHGLARDDDQNYGRNNDLEMLEISMETQRLADELYERSRW